MTLKEGNVNLEIDTNDKLTKVSRLRRAIGNSAWRKKDIIAELVRKEYKRSIK